MDKNLLLPIIEQISGCTFATLDTLTEPKKGVMCETTGKRVIIFRTGGVSGWENMVKRKLRECGKDADSFKVGPLSWGERLGNLPLIENNGKTYLQTIELEPGKKYYFLTGTDIEVDPKAFGIRPNRGFSELPINETVRMSTYSLGSIQRITLMGQTIGTIAEKKTRAILSMNFGGHDVG